MGFQQLFRRPQDDDAAPVHDRDHIAQLIRFIHIVRGQRDGFLLGFDVVNKLPEIAPGLRIQAGRGSSRNRNFGIIEQCDRQQQPLALTSG